MNVVFLRADVSTTSILKLEIFICNSISCKFTKGDLYEILLLSKNLYFFMIYLTVEINF